jgi:hemerythrin-like metal-binding protein
MSVGVDLIDSDHQALIALINELHDALEDAREDAVADDNSPALRHDIFDRLLDYIELHFVREEAVMKVCDYPDFRKHQVEHERFTHQTRYIRDRYMRGEETEAAEKLLVFLKNWLRHHILVEDMAYRSLVEGNEEAIDMADNFGPGLNESVPKS